MLHEIIPGKVYYKIFDKTYPKSTGYYNKKDVSDDKLAETNQNLSAIAKEFNAAKLITLNQVHGSDVLWVDDNFDENMQISADGVVTNMDNVALSIKTADCCPVLFSCSNGLIIGSAHLGWRSSKADLIENIVKMMLSHGAQDLCAIIGPTIMQKSYEVDHHYYQSFLDDNALYKQFFIHSNKSGHYMFDLIAFVKYKLAASNVNVIHSVEEDTYSNPDKYFSYRRCSHTNETYNGHILSVIMKGLL